MLRTLMMSTIACILMLFPMLSMAETYTLKYKDSNKWVAAGDKTPLRALLNEAKTGKHNVFHVVLPKNKRDLSINRLKVLRDIMENSFNHGVLLQEKDGETPANTLAITPYKKP